MIDYLKDIDKNKIPQHVAIIMDGNGRWAKKQGKDRIYGHQNGVQSVREVCEISVELGIKYLTLYAFSTENWSRPKEEVDALMDLLVNAIHEELSTLEKNNIKLKVIGDLNRIPDNCRLLLNKAIERTSKNTVMNLIVALSYSSRWEITDAVKKIARDVLNNKLQPEQIDENIVSSYLSTSGIPDPELLIRTSGEQRLSNFLLWQCAYSEFYFTPVLWPDFRKTHFIEAIIEYQRRERRFGMTSEQIKQ